MNLIPISDFKGVYTNADPLDIPDGAMLELKNMYPKNGRLVKTFGIGAFISMATMNTGINLYTFIESHLTLSGMTGEMYIVVYVSSYVVTLYVWGPDGVGEADWYSPSTIFSNWTGTFYHKNEKNPIIVNNNVLRLLPGNVGEDGSSHECKGIWFGYIDHDYFDGNYKAGTDYTAAFFNYATTIDRPTIANFTFTKHDYGAFWSPTSVTRYYYYRITYVYDGIQESLMSDSSSVAYNQYQFLEISHTFDLSGSAFNKRLTGMNIYRSITDVESPVGDKNYYLIDKIDLLRESTKKKSGANGAYYGIDYCYITDPPTFTTGKAYTIKFNNTGSFVAIDNPVTSPVTNNTALIHRSSGAWADLSTNFPDDYWDCQWEIQEDGGAFASSTNGAFLGTNALFINEDIGIENYAGGVAVYDGGADESVLFVEYNYEKAVRFYLTTSVSLLSYDNVEWLMLRPLDGNYDASVSGTTATIRFFDTRLSDGASHPLEGEVSIKVNGRYAAIIGERLWQANVVLDPGGDNEARDDWATYSEIAQYDVNPVSNIIIAGDDVGGAITGLHSMLGNPVFCKQHSLVTLLIRNSASPAGWVIGSAPHHIGNLATRGSITVLDTLYVCYIDGIYELTPNNLAATDSTPTNKLKISDPIGDIYQAISDKTAIISGYEPRRNEIMFKLDANNVWAFSIETREWRQISSAVAFTVFANDENGDLIVYGTDKKVYSFNASESVTSTLKTKVYEVSLDDNLRPVQDITVTYKSAAALTMKVYWDDVVESGSIEYDVTYTVVEEPYVNGSTYKVTYNGVEKTNGQTFTGLVGCRTYTVTAGTGIVVNTSSFTLPANTARQQYTLRMGRWAKRMKIEITSASGTGAVEIDQIVVSTL